MKVTVKLKYSLIMILVMKKISKKKLMVKVMIVEKYIAKKLMMNKSITI